VNEGDGVGGALGSERAGLDDQLFGEIERCDLAEAQ
jgi:hypothetical protein